ncbi:hypothetical protein [Silvanigrella aquatica]|uniref:Uncharacterized protein n=1 Tax=Silvanigrella aquatica TaxID=1915309 RepID=A0A1L4D501_9BACT|nr:hypothetical protein [Silvanigrella aquatica]APJ05252.1 hypothetical protein AXG55_14615 [Silvanigrella aquatica]
MVRCYMCDKDVEKYKSNSHIISEELFKNVKEHGKMISIDNAAGINKYSTKEIEDDFICPECENKTRHDDGFAKDFFIDKKYLKSSEVKLIIDGQQIDLKKIPSFKEVEKIDHTCFPKFKLFVLSLLLRHYCYLKVHERRIILPDEHLNEIRKLYHNKDSTDLIKKYPIVIWKYDNFNNSVYYPIGTRIEGINAIDMLILGYRIHMYIDKRHHFNNGYKALEISNTNFNCFVFQGKSQLIHDLMSNVSSNKTSGKLQNISVQAKKRKK